MTSRKNRSTKIGRDNDVKMLGVINGQEFANDRKAWWLRRVIQDLCRNRCDKDPE